MSYKNLKNFRGIIYRADFGYVSNISNINNISEILLLHLRNPDGNETDYILILKKYLGHLESFFNWFNCNIISPINEGGKICLEELSTGIKILSLPKTEDFKRTSISRGHTRKMNKMFLFGLSSLLEGIRLSFRPQFIAQTSIEKEQLVRYILDKQEGLGNRFKFNTMGNNCAYEKLGELNVRELIVAVDLLVNNKMVRTTRNGWIDMGQGLCPVRLLLIKRRKFGFIKEIVAFIFRLKEHKKYKAQLNVSPNGLTIKAA